MKAICAFVLPVLLISTSASADPEKAYQAGKALSNQITGNKSQVDDRDLEQ